MENLLALLRTRRADLAWSALLTILTVLAWCLVYHRWTVASWQIPITYLADPQQSDVIQFLARIRAARDGHQWPVFFSDIPELGAPFVANWDDYPMSEKPLFCTAGLLARVFGLFAGANLTVLLGHVLAALSFYAACRCLRGAPLWAAVGAMTFALSRFAFAESLYHLTVLYYWHIPLCLLVCRWLFEGEVLTRGRLIFALAVAFITGVQHVYYANLFGQFVLLGGLAQFHRGGWRALGPAAAIIGVMALGFLLMQADSLAYAYLHGNNYGILDRRYMWMEVYGLKLVDMVMPPPDHPLPLFARWSMGYMRATMLSPGEIPTSAYLGLIGLASLAWLTWTSLQRVLRRKLPPLEAFMILWIILYSSVGGLGGLAGTMGFGFFRTTTRFSIVILCLTLLFAVRRLSGMAWRPAYAYPLAACLVVLAWWDQAPPTVSSANLATTAATVESDRQFTGQMEQQLPSKAMVFQLPVMDYPENGAAGVPPYNHFRPYLYSHHLRFSYGSMKGRPQADWQHAMDPLSVSAMIDPLESYGFSAIYMNVSATADRGAGLVSLMRGKGYRVIESEQNDLLCIFIHPRAQPKPPF